MKLICCIRCSSIVSLTAKKKVFCHCRESWGQYNKEGTSATIGGKAIAVGINNSSFYSAFFNRTDRKLTGASLEFKAFFIPKECNTVIYEKDGDNSDS